jgi:simple sugar transport system ATP-binding protein
MRKRNERVSSLAGVADARVPPTPDGDVVIAARGIGKVYGHVRALHDVSFELHRGEVVAIFGDNGAGKSTFAKCLCGVVTPDTGQIEVASRPVEMHSIRDAERFGITAVHQDLALAPDLTVLENMFLGREISRPGVRGKIGMIARGAMARESEQALAALQIKLPSVRVQVAALSGGQKQAVAVARAAMWSTTGILMDEPTAALGTRQSDVVCELIRRTADNGLGVMVISHDLPRILAIADRIIVLRHGMVALTGSPGEITRRDVVDAMVGYHERTGEPE